MSVKRASLIMRFYLLGVSGFHPLSVLRLRANRIKASQIFMFSSSLVIFVHYSLVFKNPSASLGSILKTARGGKSKRLGRYLKINIYFLYTVSVDRREVAETVKL